MKKTTLFTMALLLALYSSVLSAPLDQSRVPADSGWMMHVDFEAFRQSHFGRLMHAEIQEKYAAKVESMTKLLGSDLTTDLDALTVFGPDANEKLAAALIQGTFNRDQLLSLLSKNEQYSNSDYGGYTLHHWFDQKKNESQVGTFAADDLIVISQTVKGVTNALDVLSGKSPSLAQAPSSSLGSMLPLPADALMVAAARGLSDLANSNEHAALLQNSRMMMFVAGESQDTMKLHAYLEADSAQSAQQIEQVMRGMLAFGMLQQKKHPQAAPLLAACQITRTDNAVDFEFLYPSQDLFDILKTMHGKDHPADESGSDAEEQTP